MNQEQKAQVYNQMMNEYTKLENQVSAIKGESFEMNESQQQRINELKKRMLLIESQAARL